MLDFTKKLRELPDFISLSGATMKQIDNSEKKLNVKFSNEYRTYLFEFGVASADGHEFTGICTSSRLNVIDVTLVERNRNPKISNDYYVVEQTNFDGIVVWQSNTGEVFQTSPNMQIMKLCDSLCEYLEL